MYYPSLSILLAFLKVQRYVLKIPRGHWTFGTVFNTSNKTWTNIQTGAEIVHLDVVLHIFLLCWHLQKAFQVIFLGWRGCSGPLLQLHQVEPLLPQHTGTSALDNTEGRVWRSRGTGLVAAGGTSGTLPGGQAGSASIRSWKDLPWKEHLGFIPISLKYQTGSLVLKLCTRGTLSPAKIK